ncbi:Uncharacterised protein [Streptococcus pyogenes]|nr:Uncharacterised protein [Streptococcus pyogenes]VGT13890.1 Uncharacterised protein [Streptococcus pyogenes]VGT43277.1 Uncharacterised protein [Streptococcus pyogenes]VGT47595.1 Uncharacterised protein [Streptococcus pyogenes]VGU04430.1 Uncharacterised protein [Streptococcus pyogenes]
MDGKLNQILITMRNYRTNGDDNQYLEDMEAILESEE